MHLCRLCMMAVWHTTSICWVSNCLWGGCYQRPTCLRRYNRSIASSRLLKSEANETERAEKFQFAVCTRAQRTEKKCRYITDALDALRIIGQLPNSKRGDGNDSMTLSRRATATHGDSLPFLGGLSCCHGVGRRPPGEWGESSMVWMMGWKTLQVNLAGRLCG